MAALTGWSIDWTAINAQMDQFIDARLVAHEALRDVLAPTLYPAGARSAPTAWPDRHCIRSSSDCTMRRSRALPATPRAPNLTRCVNWHHPRDTERLDTRAGVAP